MRHQDKPILTQDGNTLLYGPRPVERSIRPEERIASIMGMVKTYELLPHSRISKCREPEYWEYKYLTDTRNPVAWEEFKDTRKPWRGYYVVAGNFVEVSGNFRLLTRDEKLVQEFKEAFRCNPGCAEMAKYAADCEEYFDGLRKRWGVLPPEENQ